MNRSLDWRRVTRARGPTGSLLHLAAVQFGEGQDVVTGSPTLRQRELGLRLRRLRTELSMTVEDVADKLLCSPAKISRMETAARRPSPRDVRDLCVLYNVAESAAAELMQLARQAREQGWWTQYEDLNLNPYVGLEQAASSITCYHMNYIPGLLQTGDYACAIIKGILPQIDPKILQSRVDARLRRQDVLERENPPRYRVLLDEAVLHRQVGSASVMAAQLARVTELAHAGKTTVQVIPFKVGAYPSGDNMFVFLEFSDPVLPPVVYVEGPNKSQYYESAADLAYYREAAECQRDVALSPRDSVKLLEEMSRSYADQ